MRSSARKSRAVSERYRTVRREGLSELTVKGSRFIGICRPIATEADALELQDDARRLYPDARHYVHAWRLDAPVMLQRFSDDGEPRGTGGRQLLDALLAEGIDRAALLVVRYFGGVLLGTGGLSRAYAGAAREALAAAEPVSFLRSETFWLETDYAVFHQLEGRLRDAGFFLAAPDYGEAVRLLVGAPANRVGELHELVMSVSNGAALIEPAGERWIEHAG